MINLNELSLVSGKAAWMAYLVSTIHLNSQFGLIIYKLLKNFLLSLYSLQDIYCLDADGALFDAALLASVAAFSRCETQIPFC